jgi:sphinganine-1-phosphate aldolase
MGPKGLSCLLFRDSKLRSYQFFVTGRWNGGLYATTTIAGSRPGTVIAATWAVMMKIGRAGYVKNAKVILDACSGYKKAIKAEMPEVVLATHHDSCVVTFVGTGERN